MNDDTRVVIRIPSTQAPSSVAEEPEFWMEKYMSTLTDVLIAISVAGVTLLAYHLM